MFNFDVELDPVYKILIGQTNRRSCLVGKLESFLGANPRGFKPQKSRSAQRNCSQNSMSYVAKSLAANQVADFAFSLNLLVVFTFSAKSLSHNVLSDAVLNIAQLAVSSA